MFNLKPICAISELAFVYGKLNSSLERSTTLYIDETFKCDTLYWSFRKDQLPGKYLFLGKYFCFHVSVNLLFFLKLYNCSFEARRQLDFPLPTKNAF